MAKGKRYGKLKEVIQPLRKAIQNGDFPNGVKLPTIRTLSAQFEVSVGTVQSALSTLEKEGLVLRKPGSGVVAQSTHPDGQALPLPSLQPARAKAESIADEITEEITSGNLRVGEQLPLRKMLRFRMKTSFPTLSRALKMVEQRGIIHRRGTALVVGPPNAGMPEFARQVYALSVVSGVRGGEVLGALPSGFLLPFEKELAGFGASFVGRHNVIAGGERDRVRPSSGNALGYFYPARDLGQLREEFELNPRWMDTEMKRLTRLAVPCISYNAAPVIQSFPSFTFKPYRNVFAFGLDNRKMGSETAVYLGTRGHRNVAMFSYMDRPWAESRFEGLRRKQVNLFGKDCRCRYFSANMDPFNLRGFRDIQSEEVQNAVGNFTDTLFKGYRFSDPNLARRIAVYTGRTIAGDHNLAALRPFFEKALQDPTIAAWVGADSSVALAAAKFLQAKGIRVPEQLSLVGLDDNESLADYGITGYDPQVSRMGYLAAHCILGDIPIRRTARGLVDCPGKMIERGSVARKGH